MSDRTYLVLLGVLPCQVSLSPTTVRRLTHRARQLAQLGGAPVAVIASPEPELILSTAAHVHVHDDDDGDNCDQDGMDWQQGAVNASRVSTETHPSDISTRLDDIPLPDYDAPPAHEANGHSADLEAHGKRPRKRKSAPASPANNTDDQSCQANGSLGMLRAGTLNAVVCVLQF